MVLVVAVLATALTAGFAPSPRAPRVPEQARHVGEEARERGERRDEGTQEAERRAGEVRRAIEQKHRLAERASSVRNASVTWRKYGTGPLSSAPGFDTGYGNVAGLTAGFGYDPSAKRLFAAVSAGGVWMSSAVGGDVGTLADHWTDVGRRLPTQSTAHVAWTPAGGGTLVVLTGEHTLDGGSYPSLGVYWTTDLGKTWHHATGMPDSSAAFRLAVDPSDPRIVYAGSAAGLYRSVDAARSFTNVRLPVSPACAGQHGLGPCQYANMVTDVVVRGPGGSTHAVCGSSGCPVLAAVGWPWGQRKFPDGTVQAPGNGLYSSSSGAPGTFERTGLSAPQSSDPLGFAPRIQIGRVELGAATGPQQDHNVIYAVVNDAVLENLGLPVADVADPDEVGSVLDTNVCAQLFGDPAGALCSMIANGALAATTLNGIYVSKDFGATWQRLADEQEITYNPSTGSSLASVETLVGYGPGVQSSYNEWIDVDPTQVGLGGAPTRMAFGLEEIFTNSMPVPYGGTPATPDDFKVIGTYFNAKCAGVATLFISCPPEFGGVVSTTHPDQHDGMFIPDGKSGVWLFAANDGGVFKQHSSGSSDGLDNNSWSMHANDDFNTLLVYGLAVAKDNTVYFGLQDNGTARIRRGGIAVPVNGGDGVYAAVDPNHSRVAYFTTPGLAMVRTTDGGESASSISPPTGTNYFASPFALDDTNAQHLVAVGSKVAESVGKIETTGDEWTQVFDLGRDKASGTVHQARTRALRVHGSAVYVGWCGPCKPVSETRKHGEQEEVGFVRGLATNVGGPSTPKSLTQRGWHNAALHGLPNRSIQDIEIDPKNVKHVFVAMGDYNRSSTFQKPGQYDDVTKGVGGPGVYESFDAGQTFHSVTGDLPKIAIKSLLLLGDQLVAGTDIGAFISGDTHGTHWAPFGDLPSIEVTQFVRDPANPHRLYGSTHGRGLWVVEVAN